MGNILNKEAETNCELDFERANIYALLSAILQSPPTENLIKIITQCQINNITWQNLKNSFTNADLEQLEQEYNQLFIGIVKGEVVPYFSYYLTGFLMEKPLLNLREDMINLGLKTNQNQKDPEDHISGIFEIMNLIITDLDLDYQTQQRFFKKYIVSWMEKFFDDLHDCKNATHYQHLAKFATWFIQVEKQYFG